MTIYFNPRYDSSVFLTADDCGLGKAYSGKEALLGELELRAGLTCANIEHADRVIAYMEAMQAAQQSSPLFYSESFERDDFGTAELMLGWRDALVKAGWDGKPAGESEKIRVLSLIESRFCCPGSADRWRNILKEAARRPILKASDRIIVQCPYEYLEPVMQHLFDSINALYETPVVEYHSVAVPITKDSKCKILEFDNEYPAHEWIASQTLDANDVVAEADEALLGDNLHILGKPGIGAADEGIGAIMRLLPLGLSLFKYPADINSLQSYLQSPRSPLGKLYTQGVKKDGSLFWAPAVRQLYDHICSEGGFGKEWNDILEKAIYAHDGTPLPEADRKKALKFIGMWEQSRELDKGQAPVSGVVAFIKGLNNWAGGNVNPESELNTQFQALQRYCGAMLRLLDGWNGDTISVEKLSRWASHICVPINISTDYARLGSMNVVGNVADIFSPVKHLYWFAATTEDGVEYEYDFLSPSEIKSLKAANVFLPEKELMARLDKAYRLEGLSRCENVTIITCKRISGIETVQSALLAEISDCVPTKPGKPVAKTVTGNVETDLGKAAVHHFDPKILDGFHRKAESYSSINTLLMSPVDYLLDYLKSYRQYGTEEVADIATTEGTVAHVYIETLGQKCGYDPITMRDMHKSCFDSILNEVISENGLVLCLEENSLEEKSFRVGLRESVGTLLGIIIENGLVIEGFEYEITADIANIGPVYAKIDCLLKDPADGDFVIIDFKYNSGKTYLHKIEDNRELQLAVYRKVVETGGYCEDGDGNRTVIPAGKVKFIGYYAIPRRTLFTPENTLADNPAVEEVAQEDPKDIFEMAVKGYIFRWSQLRDGILEEGEDLPQDELGYFHQPDLYPLDVNYDDKKNTKLSEEEWRKERAYGDKNITLKGGLK